MAYITRHGNKWKVRIRKDGVEYVTTIHAISAEQGREVAEQAERMLAQGEDWTAVRAWARCETDHPINGEDFARMWSVTLEAARTAKKRADKRGIEYTLTHDDLRRMYASGACSISGVAFCTWNPEAAFRSPWVPSLDRIDPSKGYTPENTRLVCAAVNLAMNEWGEGVVRRWACHMAKKRGTSADTQNPECALTA